MRIVPVLFSFGLVATSLGCSRKEHPAEQRSSSVPVADSALESAGPRAELLPSVPSAEASDPGAGEKMPIVDGPALLQKIRDSGQKGVVVNAWASWCDSCTEELPMLARVAPHLAALGVPIWLVSVDAPEGFPAAQALLDSLHIELPRFAAEPPLQDFKRAMNPKWPGMIPVSFLFDGSGKLRYFWAGEVFEQELLPVVEGFAAGKHIDGMSDFGLAPGATHGADH